MARDISRTVRVLLMGSLAATATIEALAQSELEEVVVTARKREEALQDIPAAISVIGAAQIEREGVDSIKDVARLTPGLVFDLGFVPQDTRAQIRGLPATRGRPPVGILIDGIDVSSESLQTAGGGMLANARFLDLERVEIQKGPQSALYGRAAFGGAINYVTAQPKFEPEFRVTGDFGDYGKADVRLIANGGVSDTLALRATASYGQHDGFYRNSVTGAKIGGFESKTVSVAALWKPNDDFTLNARISYSDDQYDVRPQYAYGVGTNYSVVYPIAQQFVGICLGLLPAGFPTGPQAACPAGSTRIIQSQFPNPAAAFGSGIAPRPGALANTGLITLSADPFTGKDFSGTTLEPLLLAVRFDWNLGAVRLQSWTGYADAESNSQQDADSYGRAFAAVTSPTAGTAEPLSFIQAIDYETSVKQINQEFRLSNAGEDARVRWAIGALYWREEIDQLNRAYAVVQAPQFFPAFSAIRAIQLAGRPAPGVDAKTTKHASLYGLLEFDITEQFTVGLEARYNKEDYDYTWLSPARSLLNPLTPTPTWAAPVSVSNTSESSFTTPRLTLDYKLSDDVLLYAVAAIGKKPGGFITLAGTPTDFARFEAETLKSYELGVKTQWLDGRITLNGNLFFMKNEDKLFTSLEPDTRSPTGSSLRASNSSDAESRGLELEGRFVFNDNFSFSLNYAYTDAKYTRFAPLTTGALGIIIANNCTIRDDAAAPGAGNVAQIFRTCVTSFGEVGLERAPDHAAAGTATFQTPIGGGDMKLIAEATAQYVGERPEGATILGITLGEYTQVDARVGLEAEKWSAYVYADNLFEDDTVRSAQGAGDFFALGSLLQAGFPPDKRQLGVRLAYRF